MMSRRRRKWHFGYAEKTPPPKEVLPQRRLGNLKFFLMSAKDVGGLTILQAGLDSPWPTGLTP